MDDNTRWEQFRAADPARHSSPPDLEALLALTREKIARDDSANYNDNTPDAAHGEAPGVSNVIPLSSRRRVTRVLPFLAGAAAFGLIMGGGGYVIGAQNPSPTTTTQRWETRQPRAHQISNQPLPTVEPNS